LFFKASCVGSEYFDLARPIIPLVFLGKPLSGESSPMNDGNPSMSMQVESKSKTFC